jgi:hypothetical protein
MAALSGLGSGLSPGDRDTVRSAYLSARMAAEDLKYDEWHKRLAVIGQVCKKGEDPEKVLAAELSMFELFYVTFYDRGLASAARKWSNNWLSAIPDDKNLRFTKYLGSVLKPEIERRAKVEDDRIAALDFRSRRVFDRRPWRFTPGKSNRDNPMGYAEAHLVKPVKQEILYFAKPQFQEAVVTGQVLLRESRTPTPDEWHMTGCGIGRQTEGGVCDVSSVCTMGQGNTISAAVRDRWRWFRMHADHRGNGKWFLRYWIWLEGRQPADIRSVDSGVLPPTQREHIPSFDKDGITRTGHERDVLNFSPTAGAGLMGQYLTASWRAVGVEVIRRPGDPIFSEDFEKGLGKWTEHIGGEKIESRDHLSTVQIDTSRGRSAVLRVDCAKAPDKLVIARPPKIIEGKSIVVECDARLEKAYEGGNSSRWHLLVHFSSTGTREMLYDSPRPVAPGTWVRYRRELVVKKEAGAWTVHTAGYVNGKLRRRTKITLDSFDGRFLLSLGVRNSMTVFDNLVVKELKAK